MSVTFTVNADDLAYILKQIEIAEREVAGETLQQIIGPNAAILPWGLRHVDGTNNNLLPGGSTVGAADQILPRLTDPMFRNDADGDTLSFGAGAPQLTNTDYARPGSVVDADPRIISNLIVEQRNTNPAAVAAWHANPLAVGAYQDANGHPPLPDYVPTDLELSIIPNQSPDVGLSPQFNGWMTFFGQFFDHGLDLITKGGNGTVYVPLQPDDPLYVVGSPTNFMALTRSTPAINPTTGLATETVNTTTPWIDQNQTYTSHASHQVFLREYARVDADGAGPGGFSVVATGRLLDGANGGMATWGETKAQASTMLGITLDDYNVSDVPLLRTDAYGEYVRGTRGFAQLSVNVAIVDADGQFVSNLGNVFVEGRAGGLDINALTALDLPDTFALPTLTTGQAYRVMTIGTGHAFLNDIAHHAEPVLVDLDHDPLTPATRQVADADLGDVNHDGRIDAADLTADDNDPLTYDDEMLDAHFVTGDGRGNENIGLTAVHTIFHSEHNRLVEANKDTIIASGDAAVVSQWLAETGGVRTGITQAQLDAINATADPAAKAAAIDALNWDGERLFQAAKFVTEMEYQHLVFEEFARTVQPAVNPFVFTNTPDIDPAIVAEFAHAVYRFGHSMLTNTIDVLDPNMTPSNPSLFDAFLNPQAFGAVGGTAGDAGDSAGNIIRGMTRQAGNEIDEFVVNDLRNRLVGLPLDLAALNIARGREAGVAPFNVVRDQLYHDTGNVDLRPYDNWLGFAQNLKNPLSIVNFIAAYGTHPLLTAETTLEGRRAVATALVLGSREPILGDPSTTVDDRFVNGGDPIADRIDFLNSTGSWAFSRGADGALGTADDVHETGLNHVDLWIGGLAERKTEFGGMLGSTFNYVFEAQMEHLQDGDRLYYLSRLQGLNLLNEMEPNTFSELVMRNTNLGDVTSSHLPGHLFQTPDLILELDQARQIGADPLQDSLILQAIDPKVTRHDPGTDIDRDGHADGGYLRISGGEHTVLGGTEGNDTLIGDRGIDTLWGDGGDDYLNAGTETDEVFGGDGDDIIVDPFGSNFLRGEVGNDVIAVGSGFNTIFGGEDQDFIVLGIDGSEVFAGRDDDFVLGGSGADGLMGNEGDDWIEGGDGFDSLSGENSQLFFNSTIIGNDVLNGQGNDTDYDGESGDDIMFEGPGIQRNNGMLGYDWGTHKGDPNNANSDLALGIVAAGVGVAGQFPTQPDLTLRDRFDSVEALSGWIHNDVLKGTNEPLGAVGAAGADIVGGTQFDSALRQSGVTLIHGLRDLIAHDFGAVDLLDPNAVVIDTSTGANILLGGAGSDDITGQAGNDIIDGDAWLNTRIAVHANRDGTGALIGTAEGMTAQVHATDAAGQLRFNADGTPVFLANGETMSAAMLDRSLNPGQLEIVREIVVDPHNPNDVDVAHFNDVRANYTITRNADRTVTVTQNTVTNTIDPFSGRLLLSDGVDTLHNIEFAQFSDQRVSIGNAPPQGSLVITGAGNVLTADRSGITDANGLPPGNAAFSYQWQTSADGLGGWTSSAGAATGRTYTVGATDLGFHRVIMSYTDGGAFQESVTSVNTALVGRDNAADTLVGSSGPNLINGQAGADTLGGAAGNDVLNGGVGADVLTGGGGDDTLNGGAGTDRAVFAGPVQDYAFAPGGTNILVADTVAGRDGTDTLAGIEQVSFGAQTLNVVTSGTATLTGTGTADLLLGFAGNDTLNGNAGNDVLVGGAGTDAVNGNTGNDTILWRVGDGRDVINGDTAAGNIAGTVDTVRIDGNATSEAYTVHSRTAWLAIPGNASAQLNSNTEIVVTRNGTGNAAVIAELNNVEEIVISGHGGSGGTADSFVVNGSFAGTSLATSTITLDGSVGDDVVDISALTSAHRIVFTSRGGHDTIIGTLRPQDVIELPPGAVLASYVSSTDAAGTTTLSHGTDSITFAGSGAPTFSVQTIEQTVPGGGGTDTGGGDNLAGSGAFALTASDVAAIKNLVNGLPGGEDNDAVGIRDLEGTGNNRAHPDFGSAAQPFIRITDAHYGAYDPAIGNNAINPIFGGLDPRAISDALGAQEPGLPTNEAGANSLFTAFGQYFDHGLDFLSKGGNGTIAIGVPGSGNNPADLTRGTVEAIGADGVPQHLNMTSPFADQNQTYGSDERVGTFLREGDGHGGFTGRLLQGAPDPSNPDFRLLPNLRELIQNHWANDTVFTDAALPGGTTTFRSYYAGLVGADGTIDPTMVAGLAANFMNSGFPLLLDTNPFIGLLDHYVAGDGRANENIGLTSVHTIWARNHNFQVDNLLHAGFVGTTEELFQAAKLINEVEYQRVVFTEFADRLLGGLRGEGDHGFAGYNPEVDASVSHEFATAAYRFGHSLIGQTLTVLDAQGHPRDVLLFDAFLNPTNDPVAFTRPLPPGYVPAPGYEQLGVNSIIAGGIVQAAEEVDVNVVDAVRNDLIRISADVFALDVAREWDVGLGTLNQVRADLMASTDPYVHEAVGYAGDMTPYASWEDFQARNHLSDTVTDQFRQAYPDLVLAAGDIAAFRAINPGIVLGGLGHDTVQGIDRVDLFVGGLAETHINGGVVGQTMWAILHEQMDRLQEGDRLYYRDRAENLDLYNIVEEQGFGAIIARNTGLTNLRENVFDVVPPGSGPTGPDTLPPAPPVPADVPVVVPPGAGPAGPGTLPPAPPAPADVPVVVPPGAGPAGPGTLPPAPPVPADVPVVVPPGAGPTGPGTLPPAPPAPAPSSDAAGSASAGPSLGSTLDHTPPTARADAASGMGVAAVLTGHLLANDADASALHVVSVQFANGLPHAVPASGTVQVFDPNGALTLSADGSYSYRPTGSGHAVFIETVADAAGNTSQTTLTLDVAKAAIPAALSFAFALTDARFDFSHGHALMTAPDGTVTDLTGVGTIAFTDGIVQERDGSPLVDDLYYAAHNLDVWRAHVDPDQHYAAFGWHEGRDPNAVFSTRGYLATNTDVATAGIDPLIHYDSHGWHEGRSPGATFSAEAYLATNADVAAAGIDPLAHYLEHGQAEDRFVFSGASVAQGSGDHLYGPFNATAYLARNADVAAAVPIGHDRDAFAFQHYLTYGAHEGRDPDASFSTSGYLAANPDVAANGINPLLHYEAYGWREGRDSGAGFHANAYLAANPDVAMAQVDPMQHYLQYGHAEGRHLA